MKSSVKITYFDPFHIYDAIRSELEERLPLTNLHWKSRDGTLKIIPSIDVEFVTSDLPLHSSRPAMQPFINCVLVSCESIDEYRSKTRPLIRNWLPSEVDNNSKYVIILHSNKDILDSNLFKTVSLLEKFNKDFPNVKAIETKTVYKSNEEKTVLWNSVLQRLKQFMLEIFQSRVDSLNRSLEGEPAFLERVSIHEDLLKLYLNFHLPTEAEHEFNVIRTQISQQKDLSCPIGTLRLPINDDTSLLDINLKDLLARNELNKFQLYKQLYLMQFALSTMDLSTTVSQKRVVNGFYDFISSLAAFFKGESGWLEFKYKAIDEFIEHSIFKDIKTNNWNLQICDLKREQRDIWVELGCSCKGHTLSFKTFRSNGLYSGDILEHTFMTEEIFHANFIKTTKDLITLYSSCVQKRQRVMDWLSVEIALLHYDRGEYEDCVSILHSSYDFYMENNWSKIGSWLLKYYIESLLNCNNIKELDIDGEMVPKSIVVENAVLNILPSSGEDKHYWWKEFKRISKTNNDNLIYPLDKFLVAHVESPLIPLEFYQYGLRVKLHKMHIPEDIKVTSIKLLVKNYMDQFLCFEAFEFVLGNDEIDVMLHSNDIIWDTFEYVMLEVLVEGIVFKKEFASFETENSLTFLPCSRKETPKVLISPSIEQKLSNHQLCLQYKNFEEIDSFTLTLTVGKEHEVQFQNGESSLIISCPDEYIPVLNKKGRSEFKLNYNLCFTVKDNQFSEEGIISVNCLIPIHISTDKIYFEDSLIFDILVRAKKEDYVMLFSTSLECSSESDYEIIDQPTIQEKLIIDSNPRNSYRTFCKVVGKDRRLSSNILPTLSVKYLSMREYLEQILETFFPFDELDWDIYYQWKEIIVPKMDYDYKAFAESEIIKVKFACKEIGMLLQSCFGQQPARKLLDLLKLLSNGTQVTNFEINVKPHEFTCPLNVNNTIKKLYSIQFCNLDVNKKIILGKPSRFLLVAKDQSKIWDDSDSEAYNSFSISNGNDWLIGGQRRFPIKTPVMNVTVNLIPLRRGYLSYPKVEILDSFGNSFGQIEYGNSKNKILVL